MHYFLTSHKHALIPDTVVRHGKSESLTGQIIYTGAEIKSENVHQLVGSVVSRNTKENLGAVY